MTPMKSKLNFILPMALAAISAAAYFGLTIFVIPPMGALPEGRTIIITRLSVTNFIDTPEALCERSMGNSNPLCLLMVTAAVAEKSTVIARLPYSEALYHIAMHK